MTGGEFDFVDELVDTYLEDGANQIAAMRTALDGGDTDALTRAAHSMKSSSLNVGALELGDLCRALEEAARNGIVADGPEQVPAIASEFARARQELLDGRERRAPG